jgi:hypothetical protein
MAPPCLKPPIEVVALAESDKISLTQCSGAIAAYAIERLSVLMRPGGTPKPAQSIAALAKVRGEKIAPGVRRVDAGLVVRLQKVIDHFGKPGQTARVLVVSGYRPGSRGSKHADARALDFRIDGVTNEDLVAFCKTLDDTGCGYYPNSTFIHMDVRAHGEGHVAWIDASGPGEAPRYVPTWPPPRATTPAKGKKGSALDRLDKEPPPQPSDEHPEKPLDPDSLPALPMPASES